MDECITNGLFVLVVEHNGKPSWSPGCRLSSNSHPPRTTIVPLFRSRTSCIHVVLRTRIPRRSGLVTDCSHSYSTELRRTCRRYLDGSTLGIIKLWRWIMEEAWVRLAFTDLGRIQRGHERATLRRCIR